MCVNNDPAMQDWLLEYQKAAYYFQLERIECIRDRVSMLSGLLTLLGGALLYVLINYPYAYKGGVLLLFYIPAISALVLFIISTSLILYVLGWGFQYSYIPSPAELYRYAVAIKTFSDSSSPSERIDALAEIKDNVTKAYAEGATHNLVVNTQRSVIILRSTQIAIISLMCLLLSLPRFVIDLNNKDSEPTKIIISEPIRMQQ